jgi:DNA-binding MarR family transcriptional regulator
VVDTARYAVIRGREGSPTTNPEGDGTDTEWPDPRQNEIWRLLVSVHARLLARLDEDMRHSHGCNLAEYEVLAALSEREGALRMTELAERVLMSPSGLTRRIDRLVRRGLVSRLACPSDGRGSLAALTAAGWEAVRRAAPTHVAGVRQYLLGPVSAEAIEQLGSGLRAVTRALDRAESGPDRAAGPDTAHGRDTAVGAGKGARSDRATGPVQPGSGPATTG